MDRIYQKKMVKTLTGLAEGFAELAGLLNSTTVESPTEPETETATPKKAAGRSRKAKAEAGGSEAEKPGHDAEIGGSEAEKPEHDTEPKMTEPADVNADEKPAPEKTTEDTKTPAKPSDEEADATPATTAETGTEKAPPRSISFEEARAVLAEKARSGFRAEVKALLAKRNVNQLSEITDPLELGALVTEAEQLHINP